MLALDAHGVQLKAASYMAVGFYGVNFFIQAEDVIRDLVRSRGLGDVYKRQGPDGYRLSPVQAQAILDLRLQRLTGLEQDKICLLYTSDDADDLRCVDLGGRRLIKKKKNNTHC